MSKASQYRTYFHRDGTVTVWDVFEQRWRRMRASNVSDAVLASLRAAERDRILEIASQARA